MGVVVCGGQECPPSLGMAARRGLAVCRGGLDARLVRGELDWVVMKCLEKDRNRRYDTASGLAADLERYLRDEPVLACPPSTIYRLGKFARRNRAGLAVALARRLEAAAHPEEVAEKQGDHGGQADRRD